MIRLTIRSKILYTIGITCFILIIFTYVITQIFLLEKFADIERQNIQVNLQQFLNTLDNDLANLNKEVGDWAAWDETYHFIETKDPDYIKRNLPDETYLDLQLGLIFYINLSGEVIYGKVFDLKTGRQIPVLTIQRQINATKKLFQDRDFNRTQTGIILSPQGPLLVAAHPILTSKRKGPSRGTLVMGRFLNNAEIKKLAEITHLPIKISSYSQLWTGFKSFPFALSQQNPTVVRALNSKEIIGYALINDISGKPALIASIKVARTIYHQGQVDIFYFILTLLIVSVILALLILLFLKKEVISRLASFNNYINRIAVNKDLSIRMPVNGNDELTNFAQVINRMMDSLEQYHHQLEESRQRVMDIIEFLPDATYVIDQNKKIVAWNRAIEKMTGVKKQEMIGKGDSAYAIPFYGKVNPMLIDLVGPDNTKTRYHYGKVQKKGAVLFAEVDVMITGQRKSLWATASPLYDKNGKFMGAIESIRDISERKKAEAELKYLSLHDQLTGFYNRAYFEEEICRLDDERSPIVGIIMCDVDGLKLVNDSLGHNAGDKLLRAAAQVIKKAFRNNDIIARIGGDEFAILLPRSDVALLELAAYRIQAAVTKYNKNNPELPLSISVGWSFRQDSSVNLKCIFEEADNHMYREKLLHKQSAHSAIVQTLMKALNARDFITEGHADRLKDLVTRLSRPLGLSKPKIHDLSLLAQFHDIGKIGIPDNILFKEGPLTPEEKIIMERHVQIGFNIAKSSQELMHISDWILMHHELWDGSGYPRGLKSEEIPLECRILAIVDAYDAMTSDRPYRKALSQQEAIQELRKYTGIQFDPKLVSEFIKVIGE